MASAGKWHIFDGIYKKKFLIFSSERHQVRVLDRDDVVSPTLFAYYGEKRLDLSGLANRKQVLSVLEMETEFLSEKERIIIPIVR